LRGTRPRDREPLGATIVNRWMDPDQVPPWGSPCPSRAGTAGPVHCRSRRRPTRYHRYGPALQALPPETRHPGRGWPALRLAGSRRIAEGRLRAGDT
jgi:hypothetical protein